MNASRPNIVRDLQDFNASADIINRWISEYFLNLRTYPVKSQVTPGAIKSQLETHAPTEGEDFAAIFEDFKSLILPGLTHWQHPRFMAYFPANNSFPSLLGEMLTSAIGAQCMSWQTSPAAAELEDVVLEWFKTMLGLPAHFRGVIETGASLATFSSLLSAREKASQNACNEDGIYALQKPFTMYASEEAHSSIDRAVRMSGLGLNYLRKITTDDQCRIDIGALENQIRRDIALGCKPLWMTALIGSTSTTAVDDLKSIAAICKQYDIWLHVDAAYAGVCLMLPEYHYLRAGLEDADSFVTNPHKWLFTNFDCTTYFVKNKDDLVNCYAMTPEYLKTREGDQVDNYRDWGPVLGRRFRALKFWFVLRSFGINGLSDKLRYHLDLTQMMLFMIKQNQSFEIFMEPQFNLIVFRYRGHGACDETQRRIWNQSLMERINDAGNMYLTHTVVKGEYWLRICIGQTYVTADDINIAWSLIEEESKR